jgi:hypothetical protein
VLLPCVVPNPVPEMVTSSPTTPEVVKWKLLRGFQSP